MSRRRSGILPALSLAFPVAAMSGWEDLGEPLRMTGLGLLLVPGIFLGLIAPGIAVSASSLPLLLIPNRMRIWWRRGQDHRPYIPLWLRYAVYAADRRRCCYCGSEWQLQLDHVRPWSRGGLSVMWNMMTLCGPCNRIKSNYWVDRDGYVHYRVFADSGSKKLTAEVRDSQRIAAEILAYELRHRWRPGRWVRAGWTLAA